MDIRPLAPPDRPPLDQLLQRIESFTPDEVTCALELIDLALTPNHPDYRVLVAHLSGQVAGYICFGPTPMTDGTWDLYWIASDPQLRGKGVGAALVAAMEDDLRSRQGRLIRVETSSTEAYGGTHKFYAAIKYDEEARLKDFYRPGDDLIILTKHL
jgi:ribosomal protein S18 acetylase RimI-like enzyme